MVAKYYVELLKKYFTRSLGIMSIIIINKNWYMHICGVVVLFITIQHFCLNCVFS